MWNKISVRLQNWEGKKKLRDLTQVKHIKDADEKFFVDEKKMDKLFDKLFNKDHVDDLGYLASSTEGRNVKETHRIKSIRDKEGYDKDENRKSSWT